MGWIGRIFGGGFSDARDPSDDRWFTSLGAPVASGVRVTHETALRVAVALACIKVIAEDIAALPLRVIERQPNGDRRPVPRHPLHDLLHDRPNDEHTAIEWREMMLAWALSRGTSVSEIVPGRRGAVDQLIPLHPDECQWLKVQDSSGRRQWQLEHRETGAPTRRLLRSELLVLRAMGVKRDSPEGLDPITEARETFGAAIAALEFGANRMANDATPSGVVEWDGRFRDEEQRNVFVRAWRAARLGRNRGSTAILEHGMKYHQISMTSEQVQYLESLKHYDLAITRIFRVSPHKVGILDRATYSNIEQLAIDHVVGTLTPWLVRFEQAVQRDLVSSPRFGVEHNVMGLLRGDVESRYQAYAIGRNWGWLSVNDVRRLENMNSIPDGDVYLQPLNMAPAGEPAPGGSARPRRERQAPPPAGFHQQRNGLWLPI